MFLASLTFASGRLDIRLVTPQIAELLAQINPGNWRFTDQVFNFAFDETRTEHAVRRGVKHLVEAGVTPRKMMFYLLAGYNTTLEDEMHRFNVLRELGVDAYVMLYRKERGTDRYHFARWVNARICEACDWEDYDRRHGDK